MSNRQKLIPELRFPEFKNDGEWEAKEVGKIFDITRGYVLAMSSVEEKQTDENPYPVFSSQTKNKGLAGFYKEYLYEDAITWTTDGANAGDVNYRSGKFYCTNVCGVLLNKKGFANKCVAELINSVSKNYVSYVGNPKLMNGVMSQIKIPIPSIKEQQKIASCLSSLDEVIETHSQKLDLLRDHKKGLMQNLFPQEGEKVPKLRFKEFEEDEDWVKKRLGDLGHFLGGGTPSRSNDDYWIGNIPWISSSDIKEDDIHNISISQYINENAIIESATKIIPKGSILFVSRVGVGKLAINNEELCTSQDFTSFIPAEVLNLFVAYYYSANKNALESLSQGTSIKGFSKSDLEDSIILYPKNPKEQQKIASCLSALDELITAQAKKIERLKQHKKGLMQGLFPKTEN